MQDAQLISQASKVESLASDGLVSVSTGAGQPQKNMELAKFAESLGSSVPLQQTSEQVSITGLYARTSDGKMVELTSDSVAQVMAGLMKTPKMVQNMTLDGGVIYRIGINSAEWNRKQMVCFLRNSLGEKASEVIVSYMKNYVYVTYSGSNPSDIGYKFGYNVDGNTVSVYIKSNHSSDTSVSATFMGMDLVSRTTLSSWTTSLTPAQDVFGYNTLEELSSGVAEVHKSVYLSKRVGVGESVDIEKGYGLLVVSDITIGKTELYLINDGYSTALSNTFGSISINRNGEYSISVKNISDTSSTLQIAYI